MTYEVDLSEVDDDLGEHSDWDDETVQRDTSTVQADLDRRDRVHMVDAL